MTDTAAPPPSETIRVNASGRLIAGPGFREVEVDAIVGGWTQIANASGLPVFVPPEGIESAVRAFAGASVYGFRTAQMADGRPFFNHLPEGSEAQKWMRSGNRLGYLHAGRVEGDSARFSLIVDPSVPQDVRDLIRAGVESGEVGLSIDSGCKYRPATRDGRECLDYYEFGPHPDGPPSVDVVSQPAAGGKFLRIAASLSQENAMSDTKTAGDKTATKTQDTPASKPDETVGKAQAALAEIEAQLAKSRELNAAMELKLWATEVATTVKASKLPEFAADLIIEQHSAKKADDLSAVDAAIEKARAGLSKIDTKVTGEPVTIGADPHDKSFLRLESMLVSTMPEWGKRKYDARDESGKTLASRMRDAGLSIRQPEGSFLRWFRESTGHEFTDIRAGGGKGRKVRASITTTTWADAWENVLNRMLLAYSESDVYGAWRNVARVTSVPNFLKQERIAMGGYPNLSTVSEGANYTAITSPGDEGHGYTPTKRGNTEDLTWEALLRDDVGAIARIPRLLGLAAARTLYEFVFDLVEPGGTNPTMDYDTTTLYDAGHSNTGTTALSAAELIVVMRAMEAQTDLSNSKRLGVRARHVLVPPELDATIFDILKARDTYPGGSTTDNEWIRQKQLQATVVEHWTDANNWAVLADPNEFDTIEIGFVQGQQEPQMFTQDNANLGSMFDADKVTHKIKHSYGGTVLRHEGVYGEVVA